MENCPGIGQRMTPAELARLLHAAADEVERVASFEGSIAWETPEEDFDQRFEVVAFVRTGNDMGQGGCILVRDIEAEEQARQAALPCVAVFGVSYCMTHKTLYPCQS